MMVKDKSNDRRRMMENINEIKIQMMEQKQLVSNL